MTAPSATWVNATGNLAGMTSECGNLTLVSADPWSTRVMAGVAAVGLYAKENSGASWTKLGAGAGSATLSHRPNSIVYDAANPDRFWETGIYGPGVFVTSNRGSTFTRIGTLTHNDFISVDMHDTARKTLIVSGHEQDHMINRSLDSGGTWTNVGLNLPANTNHSSYVLALDSDSYLSGVCGYLGNTCGVFRTHDSGATWTAAAAALSPNGAPLWHSSGKIYWPSGNGISVSSDLGVTWQSAGNNLRSPVELPDGRILALGNSTVMISSDGLNWTPVGNQLPYQPAGLTYSAFTKTMYIWRWDCGGVVLPDAIYSAGFNWQ